MGEKKPIYWALVSGWGHGTGFQVIEVTSEKNGQIYGRELDLAGDCSGITHRSSRDVLHRFDDKAFALGAIARVEAERVAYRPLEYKVRRMLQAIEEEGRRRLLAAAKGEPLEAP